jgi:nitrite reductase/ring-hydroxylating ferredoxin subunit
MTQSTGGESSAATPIARREFMGWSSIAMGCGLAAGYGTLGAMALGYLYPARDRPKAWVFVADLARLRVGDALSMQDPLGAKIVIARQAASGEAEDFVALSSTCPHLGCQVHWQAHENRFLCPCHNGVFDARGKAVSGPPAAAGQSLAHYPLKVSGGLLFIEVPVAGLRSPKEA